MRISKGLISALAAFPLVLQSCASPQFQSDDKNTPVVPVDAVIDSLKCGFSKALAADQSGRAGLLAGVAKVQLDVNVITSRTVSGGASAGIPVAAVGSFTPSFTFSNDHTLTRNTTIKFNVNLSGSDAGICGHPNSIGHDAGFSGWIGQVVASINNAAAGAPKVSMQSYLYDSDFAVVSKVGGKLEAGFTIVPVKGNAAYDSSRSDIQHINVSIAAVHTVPFFVVKKTSGTGDGKKPPTPPQPTPCTPTTTPTQPGGREFNLIFKC